MTSFVRRKHIECLLAPRSIAFVGANDKGNSGARALKGAIAAGFAGRIYPVTPNYDTLEGLTCYPSLLDLPETPDSIVASVPTGSALEILEQGEQIGARAMIFYSGGFKDAGTPEGDERQRRMVEIAERSGIAVGGPNCMGVAGFKRKFDTSFVSAPGKLKTGGISIISHSGGLINAFAELAHARDIGFNYLISAGNEAVVNAADHLDWLADDEGTNVIVACLESVKDGARFQAALIKATALKPVLILKLGRSSAGQKATIAHTGSLAGSDDVFAAMCGQHGAILVDTLDQALETAAMFDRLPLPKGDRAVIFSTSGGATVLATDLATRMGLRFPTLTEGANARMQEIYGAKRPFINPFDVGSYPLMAKGDNMTRTMQTLIDDDEVDLFACVMIIQRDIKPNRMGLFEQIRAIAPRSPKPFVLIPEATMHWRDAPPDLGAHIAPSLHDGLAGLKALIDYAAFRRTKAFEIPITIEPRIDVARRAGSRVLTEYESKKALAEAGFPTTHEELARNVDEAIAMAVRIGYPVALKLQSPDLMHKTEAGGIALGIANEARLRDAYASLDELASKLHMPVDGILIQEMVRGGVEFLVGMHRDPTFGPVIIVGAGGVFVELLGAEAQRLLPPFSLQQAEEMLQTEAATKLLSGFRGAPPADRQALARLIKRFGDYCATLDDHVTAIDLNPVMVLSAGSGAKIVDASFEFAAP